MDDAQAPGVPGYDVGRLLGRGGSADVWLVRERRTGQEYALKCFRADGSSARSSPGITQEEVQREIRILSVLEHQHLVKAYGVVQGTEPGSGPALTMDYAAGGSLGQLVSSRGRISVGETVTVLTPVAQALAYLHAKGFTHSDVSPGNVLFTGQGKPMLSDLGIARMLGDPGRAGSAGTGGFVDPSPVDAVRAGLQPERDVYSLAALGWYCLTGDPPGQTADRPPLSLLVPDVPKDLAAALEAGLNDERRLRPDALALATAVYRSAAPQPVDLAGAVHPSVLPELLTRRHVPPASWGSGLREKVQGLRRRAVASRWSARPGVATTKTAPARGKHAEGLSGGRVLRLLRRSVLPLVAAAAAVVWWLSASAGHGMWHGSSPHGPAPQAASPAATGSGGREAVPLDVAWEQAGAADPVTAAQGLSAVRDYALSSGGMELLADVNAPGSAAAAADQRISSQIAAGRRLAGFSTTLSGLAVEPGATGVHAVVRAVSATSGYQVVDPDDAVLATGPASREQPLRLVLVSVDGRWRVSDILPGQ